MNGYGRFMSGKVLYIKKKGILSVCLFLSSDRSADEFLRRVVAHAFQTEIARRDFDNDGKVAPGFDGEDVYKRQYLYFPFRKST